MSATTANRTGMLKLWLLNLVANAALLAVGYYWLLIPDAKGWQVGWSAALALLTIFLVVWLRAGTLAWFRVAEYRNYSAIGGAFRRGVRHVIPLAIWAAVFAVIALLILGAGNYTPQFAVWIRQKVNAGPSPRNVMHNTDWLLFVLLWIIVPALWLPVAVTISAVGFRASHLARSLRALRHPLYWIAFCGLLVVGAWLPYQVITWSPAARSLRQQAWSAGLRFGAAYIIFITAFLGLIWMVGETTDREDPIQ